MKLMKNSEVKHVDFFELKGLIKTNPNFVPSNLDMVYERNGKFLIGEWKRGNEKLSIGQELLLKALARMPNIDVLIICGDTDDGMVVNKFNWLTKGGESGEGGASVDELKHHISSWYKWADTGELE